MRRVFLANNTNELWDMLRQYPEAAIYAGGTDLLVRMRKGICDPSALICLERMDCLKGVREEGDQIFIGACTSHTALLADPIVQRSFPVLAAAISRLGSPHIRNMGTIGGNIVTASPAGDTLPPLYILGAAVEIMSMDKTRRLSLADFIRGPGHTDLKPGEILAGVWIKKDQPYNIFSLEKVGQRKALAISIASLAALLRVSGEGIIEEARLAWGSVGPTVTVSKEAESFLAGKRPEPGALGEAARIAMDAVSPIDDVRASKSYRRLVSGNLVLRLGASVYGNSPQPAWLPPAD